MNRAETTRFLGDLLKERLGFRSYWSREVSIDYGTNRVKRVDFMQFVPSGVIYPSEMTPMLMYEEEKQVVRKALKMYIDKIEDKMCGN